jgi:hypothetical protein
MVPKYSILFFTVCFFANHSFGQIAQRDTAKKQQVVEITSEYKPVLRNAVKINFSATNLTADTSKAKLQYDIPTQNLFYTYLPLPVKPLALQLDTALDLGTRNFIKLGFGNYSTPYAKGGFSFGDGKKSLINVYGDYISSSNSAIKYQDYSQFNAKATASYFTPKNELYGSAGISQNTYNLYGYDHTIYTDYTQDSVRQRFSDLKLMGGIRNLKSTESGIKYDPNLKIDLFSLQNKLTENSLILNAPAEKTFDNDFTIKVAAKVDATTFSTTGLLVNVTNAHNNVYQLAPSVELSGERFALHAGIAPTWDNSQLSILPDIYAEFPIKNKVFEVQAGWVGQILKNTYQNLTNINPYLLPITSQLNTREMEFYAGIKATVGKHFNFNAKASLITYHNLPLLVNDTTDYKSFVVRNETKANDFRVHADFSYINQDKFTLTSGFTINGYTGLQDNSHAWGMIPIELNASLRWWAYKSLLIKGDLNAFGGAPYLLKNNVSNTLSGGSDLSIGAEFVINKKFSAWLDFNNLLNNKYQRWYNYPVYGLNALIGVIYKF